MLVEREPTVIDGRALRLEGDDGLRIGILGRNKEGSPRLESLTCGAYTYELKRVIGKVLGPVAEGDDVDALARWLRRIPVTANQRGTARAAWQRVENRRQRESAAALHLSQAMDTYGVPDFITNAIVDAMCAASAEFGLEPPAWMAEEDGDDEGDTLAEFWRRIPDSYCPHYEPARDLARLISAVLKHPDTPVVVYNALAGGVSSLDVDGDSDGYVRLALDSLAGQKKGGA